MKQNKPIVYQLTRKRVRPALQGRFYPLQFRLPSIEQVYDPDQGITREIRYAIGESSIYKDEQAENVKLADIVFQNGKIIVDHTNPNLIKFLETSNHFKDNPNRMSGKNVIFQKLDKSVTAKQSVDKIILESQAVSACLALEWKELKGYARVLGLNVDRSADEIKHDMIRLAKQDPKKFMDGIGNPESTRKEAILDALEYGIITIATRQVKWNIGEQKGVICNAPIGRDVTDYFVEWTMTEKDGEEIFEEIVKRLDKMKVD